MSLPSASRMVSRLAARGLLRSAPDTDDRRALQITLTPAGERVVADVVGRRQRLVADALELVVPTAAFARQLHALVDALTPAAQG
jgi:DNA-binding MarR family transcriptional regulator